MKLLFSLILIFFFTGLSLIHFYWVLGGKIGLDKALPTSDGGVALFTPSPLSTAVVGIGLGLIAGFYLSKSGYYNINLPNSLNTLIGYGIPFIFILRAIGDFKYVGFFKQVNDTAFAQMDTYYYVPLSMVIGILSGLVQLKN